MKSLRRDFFTVELIALILIVAIFLIKSIVMFFNGNLFLRILT